MPDIDPALLKRLTRLGTELDKRNKVLALLDRYYDGNHPIPQQVEQAKQTRAYKLLMAFSQSNWPRLIVDSVDERLEIRGIRFGDGDADDAAWEIWQRNKLDGESGLVHSAALNAGRAFAIVWADDDGKATITPEHASSTIVEYAEGSRTVRVAALRRWYNDAGMWFATLYLPDGLYKFQAEGTEASGDYVSPSPDSWEPRLVDGEEWPLANPLDVVPVIEIGVNRRLKPGCFGSAAGEYQHAIGHIDRINYTVFSWLVAMTWSGFPLRALIGDPILRDDDDKPIAPFDVSADKLVQIENPDGKLMQLPEANLDGYIKSAEAHIKHLAAITKTPAHYLLGELVNLSADAIRAAEAGLISKTRRHQASLGEDWEEVIRTAFLVENADDPRATDMSAEMIWKDPESRSQAERADAASKLTTILPWQALAETILEATPQQISRWEAMRSSDALTAVVATPPAPTPAALPPGSPAGGTPIKA